MERKTQSRRGFFFTVMALAMLSLVLLSAQVWMATFEKSDEHSAERFRGEAMRAVLAQMSNDSLSDFAGAAGFYAMHKMVNYSSKRGNGFGECPSCPPDLENPRTGQVNRTAYELIFSGNSTPGATPIQYDEDENASYTIKGWERKIQSAASLMGVEVRLQNMTHFVFKQTGPYTVNVYFEVNMTLSDGKSMITNKPLKGDASFSIEGFLDPSVTRMDMEARSVERGAAVEKQVFRNPAYATPANVMPELVENFEGAESEGIGWFYGPITEDYPGEGIFSGDDGGEIAKISQYILVHDFDDDLPTYADQYGAVILRTKPEEERGTLNDGSCLYETITQTKCLNCLRRFVPITPGCPAKASDMLAENRTSKPFIISTGYESWRGDNVVEKAGIPRVPEQRFILIDNEYATAYEKRMGYHRIWDITALRDMTTCGFYVQEKTAPSFFQRLLSAPYAPGVASEKYGIESFVIGTWAGGKDTKTLDQYSRLDREFYTHVIGTRIKGMQGCNGVEMCTGANKDAIDFGLGKFKVGSPDTVSRYGLGKIACESTPASPCDN